jgi:hypothetical protein
MRHKPTLPLLRWTLAVLLAISATCAVDMGPGQ